MVDSARLWRRLGRRAAGFLRTYLLIVGGGVTLIFLWLLSPLPLLLDGALTVNDPPASSQAIVCLTAGSVQMLPSASGWYRIVTSVRLFRDGLAPVVVFSGGPATDRVSLAEIYADAARWLGLPETAIRIEPRSEATAEHPARLLELDVIRRGGGRLMPLLVVTSPEHGRRVRAVFLRAGFTAVRIVSRYRRDSARLPNEPPRTFGQRLTERSYRLFGSLREWTALAYYKLRRWA